MLISNNLFRDLKLSPGTDLIMHGLLSQDDSGNDTAVFSDDYESYSDLTLEVSVSKLFERHSLKILHFGSVKSTVSLNFSIAESSKTTEEKLKLLKENKLFSEDLCSNDTRNSFCNIFSNDLSEIKTETMVNMAVEKIRYLYYVFLTENKSENLKKYAKYYAIPFLELEAKEEKERAESLKLIADKKASLTKITFEKAKTMLDSESEKIGIQKNKGIVVNYFSDTKHQEQFFKMINAKEATFTPLENKLNKHKKISLKEKIIKKLMKGYI